MLQIRGDLLINCTFERAFLPFVALANPFTSPREVTDADISCYSAPGPRSCHLLRFPEGSAPIASIFFFCCLYCPSGRDDKGRTSICGAPHSFPGPPRVCAHWKDCCAGSGRERAAQRSSTRL